MVTRTSFSGSILPCHPTQELFIDLDQEDSPADDDFDGEVGDEEMAEPDLPLKEAGECFTGDELSNLQSRIDELRNEIASAKAVNKIIEEEPVVVSPEHPEGLASLSVREIEERISMLKELLQSPVTVEGDRVEAKAVFLGGKLSSFRAFSCCGAEDSQPVPRSDSRERQQ